jgi:hypothetical protein
MPACSCERCNRATSACLGRARPHQQLADVRGDRPNPPEPGRRRRPHRTHRPDPAALPARRPAAGRSTSRSQRKALTHRRRCNCMLRPPRRSVCGRTASTATSGSTEKSRPSSSTGTHASARRLPSSQRTPSDFRVRHQATTGWPRCSSPTRFLPNPTLRQSAFLRALDVVQFQQ